jgi:putative heme-binding domain-containing protein
MQYSQRDPNRDHTRGRIYRMVYKGKPLLKPVTQYGKSALELLDQLKEYELRTRYRARRELFDRPDAEVAAAVKTWVAGLDTSDTNYDRLLLEALWAQQSHHMVDVELLAQVLHAKSGEARAAAVQVLSDEWDRIPNAMALLKPLVTDGFARTRLEAVRALSFIPTQESVETALQAADLPVDYWMKYTLQMTVGALEPVWEKPLEEGTIATNNPKGLQVLHSWQAEDQPGKVAEKIIKRLLAGGMSDYQHHIAYDSLAPMPGNAENGKAIFNRICVACHRVNGVGVDYGPDLTHVAGRLIKQDIIESVIDPSAKVAPKYITTVVETKDDEDISGYIAGETPEVLTLRIAGGKNFDIPKSSIKTRESIKMSSMPEGLAAGMSSTEFLDLMSYLFSLK